LTESRLGGDVEIAFRRRVALVFKPRRPVFNPTVFDEVAFAPLQCSANERIRIRANEMLEKMEIAHLRDRSSSPFYGREKAVALASCSSSIRILLLDEPPRADPKSEVNDRFSGELQRRPEDGRHGDSRSRSDRRHSGPCHVFQGDAFVAKGAPSEILNDHVLL